MSMRRRSDEVPQDLFVPAARLSAPGNPFYDRLNEILRKKGFDAFAEELCEPYYKQGGRPSIPPGVYFRMIWIGYLEGIGSERGICWRVRDSLSLRGFLGLSLEAPVPDHSSLSRIRQRLGSEVLVEVFGWVLEALREEGLLRGRCLGIDSTTLEANASMKRIQNRVSGRSYREYLKDLAKASGEKNPGPKDLSRMDRKRKKKVSNREWEHPVDPEAQITRMKNGTTRMAHKAEHAVDMDTGAITAVEVYGGAEGDTQTIDRTLSAATAHTGQAPEEVVADAGYHANDVLETLAADGTRSYIAERKQGRRNWKGKAEARQAVYANRARIGRAKGKALQRSRGERVERTFQLLYDRCGLRRCLLRGTENVLKRLLMQAAGFNLCLLMRKLFGAGTPRGMAGIQAFCRAVLGLFKLLETPLAVARRFVAASHRKVGSIHALHEPRHVNRWISFNPIFSTPC